MFIRRLRDLLRTTPSAPLRNGDFYLWAQPPLLGKRRGMEPSRNQAIPLPHVAPRQSEECSSLLPRRHPFVHVLHHFNALPDETAKLGDVAGFSREKHRYTIGCIGDGDLNAGDVHRRTLHHASHLTCIAHHPWHRWRRGFRILPGSCEDRGCRKNQDHGDNYSSHTILRDRAEAFGIPWKTPMKGSR